MYNVVMDSVDKRITGDWIDIREKLTTPNRLRAYLKLETSRLTVMVEALRQASLDGVIELKRRMVNAIFSFIGRLNHSTPNHQDIVTIEIEMRCLIFLCGLETLYANGQVKPVQETEEAPVESALLPIMDIFHEISDRIAAEPELAKDSHLKTILMDIQLYKKEHAQFAALSANIPDDRAPQFIANTRARLEEIIRGANDHYRQFFLDETAAARNSYNRAQENLLVVPGLPHLLSVQAQEISRLRSTLLFAAQEGIRLRESLLRLESKKAPIQALLDEELKLFDAQQEGQSSGHSLSVKMARNLAGYLENSLK